MARFVFKLEAVMRQRRAVERARQTAMARAEAERLGAEADARAARDLIETSRREMRGILAPGGPVSLSSARLQAGASLRALVMARRAVLRLSGATAHAEARRRELIDATTRRKAVERLRERRFEAWKTVMNKAELSEQDERAVMAASRTDGGDS